jgi:2-dehydropantoate 2-reductase
VTSADAAAGLRVAVLGPGGVGGLLAALLVRAGASVTCLAGARTAAILRTAGVRLQSAMFGEFAVHVDAAERLSGPVDVCVVAVKATQLGSALERVPADVLGPAVVVPLLNGVEHVSLLRERYPRATVLGAAIRVESSRIEPGVIRHDSPFVTVDLAADPAAAAVERFAAALQEAGVTVRRSDNESGVLWTKLAFLAPFALLTTAAGSTAGDVRAQRRADLIALVGEVTAVARAEGAPADEQQALAFFDGVPAGMRSSMQRDADAGRPLELDAIGGAVVRLGAKHGIPTPVTGRYVDELRARHPG